MSSEGSSDLPALGTTAFVTNCFERNYRQILADGHLERLVAQHRFDFSERVLLINNVDDHQAAASLADAAVARGELTRWMRVADLADDALAVLGFKPRQFGRFLHWADCFAVAITKINADVVLFWDPDTWLAAPSDWVGPSLHVLSDKSIVAANPLWGSPGSDRDTAWEEADERRGEFLVGYGFSDVALLFRPETLRTKMTSRVPWWIPSPVSCRFPTNAAIVLEQGIDAWMRRVGRQRATFLGARMLPESTPGGNDRYLPSGAREAIGWHRRRVVLGILSRLNARDRRLTTVGRLGAGS